MVVGGGIEVWRARGRRRRGWVIRLILISDGALFLTFQFLHLSEMAKSQDTESLGKMKGNCSSVLITYPLMKTSFSVLLPEMEKLRDKRALEKFCCSKAIVAPLFSMRFPS